MASVKQTLEKITGITVLRDFVKEIATKLLEVNRHDYEGYVSDEIFISGLQHVVDRLKKEEWA